MHAYCELHISFLRYTCFVAALHNWLCVLNLETR